MVASVIERAMRFDVSKPNIEPPGDRNQFVDLVCDGAFKLGNRYVQGSASKTGAICITGVRTNRDIVFLCKGECLFHGVRIPGVAPTCNIRRRYVPHQFRIASIDEPLRGLSNVGVEINHLIMHRPLLTNWNSESRYANASPKSFS
jgi:hypothetical protein